MTHTYNGWKNRATWLVALYFFDYFVESLTELEDIREINQIEDYIKDFIDEYLEENMPKDLFICDLMDSFSPDYYQLAKNVHESLIENGVIQDSDEF